jgi:uncharacterized protein DUF3551
MAPPAKEHAMPRIVLVGAAFTAAMLLHTVPVQAQNYPWCAQYNGDYGGQNCGFSTLQQCQATVSGVGGICLSNPMYPANVAQFRRRYRQHPW